MDATPPLIDGVVVEHGALDGDQPGAGDCTLLAVSSTNLGPPPFQLVMRYPPPLFCFVLVATSTPPPVLGSFHPHSTHFRHKIHKVDLLSTLKGM